MDVRELKDLHNEVVHPLWRDLKNGRVLIPELITRMRAGFQSLLKTHGLTRDERQFLLAALEQTSGPLSAEKIDHCRQWLKERIRESCGQNHCSDRSVCPCFSCAVEPDEWQYDPPRDSSKHLAVVVPDAWQKRKPDGD